MNDNQINTAIAEACGWTDTPIIDGFYGQTKVPDYCNDLNAMHEAEKVLSLNELWSMGCTLPHVAPLNFRASARQRAEAFLRTIGKWQEAAE